jgi:hypothetical protein
MTRPVQIWTRTPHPCIVLDMQTVEITTAARRISRELNSCPANTTVAFDQHGHVTGRVYGQGVDASHLIGALILPSRTDSRLRTRWTQADAQHALDEAGV